MAYDLKYLKRVEQTSNLDKSLNVKAGMESATAPQIWVYDGSANAGNATKANMVAADYFIDAYGYLSVYDLIWAKGTDGASILAVLTSAVGGVTTESLGDTT